MKEQTTKRSAGDSSTLDPCHGPKKLSHLAQRLPNRRKPCADADNTEPPCAEDAFEHTVSLPTTPIRRLIPHAQNITFSIPRRECPPNIPEGVERARYSRATPRLYFFPRYCRALFVGASTMPPYPPRQSQATFCECGGVLVPLSQKRSHLVSVEIILIFVRFFRSTSSYFNTFRGVVCKTFLDRGSRYRICCSKRNAQPLHHRALHAPPNRWYNGYALHLPKYTSILCIPTEPPD